MHSAEFRQTNQASWDERTKDHLNSSFYDVAGFLKGESSLPAIDLAELPNIEGKRVLHLQCHFGLDTLSLARMGTARTVGVDLSPVAIDAAKQLAHQTRLDRVEFLCCDVLELDQHLDGEFDLVYASYGAICWLGDLPAWAKLIHKYLAPGGQFYLAEFHPAYTLIYDKASYFFQPTPDRIEEQSYIEGEQQAHPFYCWSHSIADVVTALLDANLQLTMLREHDYSPYNCFEGLYEKAPGQFQAEGIPHPVPMVFSLLARRP
ncbi:class I SAM-dependent methyltransferase [Paraferrimonas sedimenticola]|uniref:Type 12 methyltransferase n=1 Tax=Paraferrimonas sedimenticola TaxID=375674 RepID=A0AA37RUQ2_9GAMM|nr:class I SAM-dependent methyltransferase [Paraferrimonas sedimenticola]GLP95616.1 type 12 methyltransferase [Paraferrimonas sedimenticola]